MCRFESNKSRIGRLLEILDYVASTVAYSHLGENNKNAYMVTACVDNMKFYGSIHID